MFSNSHSTLSSTASSVKLCFCPQIARNEFLGVLSTMVREFKHDSFSDLKVLLDEDPEKDFFENIKHIQVRREFAHLMYKIYFLSFLVPF